MRHGEFERDNSYHMNILLSYMEIVCINLINLMNLDDDGSLDA